VTGAGRALLRSRRGTYVLALATFVALGLPDGVLGVAWPSIRVAADRPVSALGVLLVAQTAGYLVATAANGALVTSLGTGRLLAAATAVAACGFGAFVASSGAWVVLIVASSAVGAAAGMVDAGVNAHVAVHHGRRAMGLLHAAYGVGATAGPLLVTGLLAAERTWRSAYGAIASLQGVLLVAFLATRGSWRPAPARPPDGMSGLVPLPRARTALVLTLASFFVYTGLEIATGQWAFSLLTEERGVPTTTAGLWVAAYWASLTGGRLVLAGAGERVPADRLLGGATAGALLGTLVLWLDPGGAGAVGLPLIGTSLAPVFPTLVSLTPERLGAHRAAHAIGYQLSAAGVGAAALPAAVAVAVGRRGLEALGPSLLVMAGVLLVLHVATQWVAETAGTDSVVSTP
jgi:fucose permease